MKFRLMMRADEISHRLHLPPWVICDRFERYVNPEEEPCRPTST